MYDLSQIQSNVSIISRQSYPLNRQLDASGGEIVLRRIEALGVRFLANVAPEALVTTKNDVGEAVLEGLKLTDGSVVQCKIAVFSIGIKPRDELALASRIICEGPGAGTSGKGVKIDDELRTSAPDIYAIGECASWKGHTYGLIAPGVEMADILAFNLTQTETQVGGYAKRKMVKAQVYFFRTLSPN